MKKNDVFNEDSIFEQMTAISKAHGYDILVEQVKELDAENKRLKEENETYRKALKKAYSSINDQCLNHRFGDELGEMKELLHEPDDLKDLDNL